MSRVLPILFNTEMVQAILDGRKTVTRRLIKEPWGDSCPHCRYVHNEFIYDNLAETVYCARCGDPLWINPFTDKGYKAPYQTGDILYVRETWQECCRRYPENVGHSSYCFKASPDDTRYGCIENCGTICKMRPSIHMPKEAARIWLWVTEVRAERLQDITDSQIIAEGLDPYDDRCQDNEWFPTFYDPDSGGAPQLRQGFDLLWNSTIKKQDIVHYGWDANPWVWVIEFEPCKKPENN